MYFPTVVSYNYNLTITRNKRLLGKLEIVNDFFHYNEIGTRSIARWSELDGNNLDQNIELVILIINPLE